MSSGDMVASAAFDFLRRIGQMGSAEDVGGGGNGEELISPIRRRVSVSWALVGTPWSRVLEIWSEQNSCPRDDCRLYLTFVGPCLPSIPGLSHSIELGLE